jgi:cobyrinic acid a,c-diamide synthase
MYHTFITKNNSRNLDEWLLEPETLKYLFIKNSLNKDISIIEGVMGLYDGLSNKSTECSTASLSKLLNCPVILVVNGEGLSTSISAIIKGYIDFDPSINIEGVIINNLKSKSHYIHLKESIETYTDIQVLGYVEKLPELQLPSRHLGLFQSTEINDLSKKIDLLSDKILETVDINKLISIANKYAKNQLNSLLLNFKLAKITSHKIRIGIAKDKSLFILLSRRLRSSRGTRR